MAKASKIMIDSIQNDIKERLSDKDDFSDVYIMVAYTYDKNEALKLKEELQNIFPNHHIICDPLSLSIACHIGPHSLAIAACKKII